jgi:hypothetical protein
MSLADDFFDALQAALIQEWRIEGAIGILPASFCPTCLSGVIDMVEQLTAE